MTSSERHVSRFANHKLKLCTRHPLLIILIPFILLGGIYSLATPPLEASDEFKHYPFTQYVQAQHNLPVLDLDGCTSLPPSDDCPWLQDGGQPPLYYVVTALLTSWIDTNDARELRWMNWHAFIGDPGRAANKNLIIHQPDKEAFPWRGSVLAIHLIRFLSVGLGAITVALTYQVALELFPGQRGLALSASALTAFTPMFLFVSASVNNDTLAATMGNAALLLLIRLAKKWRNQTADYMIIDALPLGLALGLYLLGKLSALGFLALTGLVLAWISWRRRDWRPLLIGGGITVTLAALIAGWWFVRNYNLYGDLTALNYFVEIQGWRASPLTLKDLVEEFGTFRWTYWGLFGAVNVMAPRWVYTFFDWLSLAALAGLPLHAWRARRPAAPLRRQLLDALEHPWWIPSLWALILFVSLIRWTLIFYSFQGRLMFPGIAGISTLLMLGLREWTPRRYRNVWGAGIGLFLFAIAAMIPFVSIRPAYVQPKPLSLTDVPQAALRPPIDFVLAGEPVIQLIGWQLPAEQLVQPGEYVKLTLYWRSLSPIKKDLISYVNLLGPQMSPAAKLNRYPAMGMTPTSLWQPGQIWRDDYQIKADEGVPGPVRLLIDVGLHDASRVERLTPVDTAGAELGLVIIGQAKLAGTGPPKIKPDVTTQAIFDEGIHLAGADLEPASPAPGEYVSLTLYWQAQATPSRDYTVFVHLLGDDPQPLAQADGPPLSGDYPTNLWAKGETIVDTRRLLIPPDLSPGNYHIDIGLYWTEGRLPLLDEKGKMIGDKIKIVELRIE